MGVDFRSFGCYGKLMLSREFITEGDPGVTGSGLDRWLSEGVAETKNRFGGNHRERLTSFGGYRYVWSGRRAYSLAGILLPSQDAAGRLYPFTVFGSVPATLYKAGSPLFHCALDGVYSKCQDLARIDTDQDSPASLKQRLRNSCSVLDLDAPQVADGYRRFIQETRGGDFWASLLGDSQGGLAFQIVQALVETVEQLPRDLSGVHLGLRFPLSSNVLQLDHEVAFWLDLVGGLAQTSLDGCTYFWTNSPGARSDCALYLFFADPSSAQWIALVDSSSDIDSVCYLDRPYGARPEDRMDPALRRIVENAGSSLSDYIAWARHGKTH
jgi:type VI secretion system ImpM family protein